MIAAKSALPFAESAARWPIAVLFAGLLASALYDGASLHPVYSTDDVMPGRGIWSQAYLGLAKYDPDLLGPRVANAAKLRGRGEELNWWAARDHMDRIRLARWDGKVDPALPAPGLRSEWAGVGVRAPFQERMAQGAFMAAVKNHPGRVLRIYLARKPRDIVMTLKRPFTYARKTGVFVLSTLVVAAIAGALVMLSGRSDEPAVTRDMILVGGGAVLAAVMPNLWGYPSPTTMADSVLLLAALFPLGIAMGAVSILRNR